MKFDITLTKEQKEKYIFICEKLWGCCPIDVNWAMNTNLYKNYLENMSNN